MGKVATKRARRFDPARSASCRRGHGRSPLAIESPRPAPEYSRSLSPRKNGSKIFSASSGEPLGPLVLDGQQDLATARAIPGQAATGRVEILIVPLRDCGTRRYRAGCAAGAGCRAHGRAASPDRPDDDLRPPREDRAAESRIADRMTADKGKRPEAVARPADSSRASVSRSSVSAISRSTSSERCGSLLIFLQVARAVQGQL